MATLMSAATRGVRSLLRLMAETQEALVITYTKEGVHCSLSGSGKTVRRDVAARAIEAGVLAARNDGLFEGPSQTYGLNREY